MGRWEEKGVSRGSGSCGLGGMVPSGRHSLLNLQRLHHLLNSARSSGMILRLSQPYGPLACSTLLVPVDARLPELTKQLSTSRPCSSWSFSVNALASPPPILLTPCPLLEEAQHLVGSKSGSSQPLRSQAVHCVYSIIEIFSCSLIIGSLHDCLPQRLHIHLWFPRAWYSEALSKV